MIAAILLVSNIAFSQPEAFNYQGIAVDAGGQVLVAATLGLQFSILDDNQNIAYRETHTTTTTGIGHFSANVGEGNILNGSLSNIPWSDKQYFLKVEMDQNGGTDYTFTTVIELLAVPFALYARTSNNTPMGLPGEDGPQGPEGLPGPAGPRGPQGANTGQGPIGEKGPIGPIGPQGLSGEQGEQGGTIGDLSLIHI